MNNIIFLPGIGADKRLFTHLQKKLGGSVISWPDHTGCKSIKDFAQKCIIEREIKPNDILIGFSFGAMVAKEIKEKLDDNRSSTLFMISSCKNKYALDENFIKRAKYISKIPNFIFKFLITYIGPSFTTKSKAEKKYLNLLKDMAKKADIDFLKWTIKVSANWSNKSEINSIKIHGEFDEIIPYSKNDADIIIKDAHHLITLTHSEQILKIIQRETL